MNIENKLSKHIRKYYQEVLTDASKTQDKVRISIIII